MASTSVSAATIAAAIAAAYGMHSAATGRRELRQTQQTLDYQIDGVVGLQGILRDELIKLSREDFDAAVLQSSQAFIRFSLLDMGCAEMTKESSLSLASLVQCRENLDGGSSAEDGEPSYINPVQYINVHRFSSRIHSMAMSGRVGREVARLLSVRAVRLYQSAAFIKRPQSAAKDSTPTERLDSQHSSTAWHADLNQVPLDTNAFGTLWCPLARVNRSHSLLSFARGSHRDIAVRHWFLESSGLLRNESAPRGDPSSRNATAFVVGRHGALVDFSPMEPGDCTFHSGWVLHAAPPNFSGETRRALTFSFVDADAKLVAHNTRPLALEDKISWADWVDEVYDAGSTIDHALLPVTFDAAFDAAPEKRERNRDADAPLLPAESHRGDGSPSTIDHFEHPGYLP